MKWFSVDFIVLVVILSAIFACKSSKYVAHQGDRQFNLLDFAGVSVKDTTFFYCLPSPACCLGESIIVQSKTFTGDSAVSRSVSGLCPVAVRHATIEYNRAVFIEDSLSNHWASQSDAKISAGFNPWSVFVLLSTGVLLVLVVVVVIKCF